MELLHVVADPSDKRVTDVARACLAALGTQLLSIKKQILEFDRQIMAWHRSDETSRRLRYIPGVGSDAGYRSGCQYCRSEGLPIGAQLLGLDWAGAKAALKRGQGQARQYQQTG